MSALDSGRSCCPPHNQWLDIFLEVPYDVFIPFLQALNPLNLATVLGEERGIFWKQKEELLS